MNQLTAYLKFWWKSKNEHGVHSPFVFDLLTQCLYNKESPAGFAKIKQYRQELLADDTVIKIQDFGAGSRVFNSEYRKVKAIAKHSGLPLKRAKLLNKLTNYLEVKTALELGTSLGLASVAIAAENNLNLITIEGCRETAQIARRQFEKYRLTRVEIKVGKFEEFLNSFQNKKFDLLYFDGNHQKSATLYYFNKLVNCAHNDSVFIFDDIHWSKEMEEAWEKIKSDPKVTVTIDCFYWGIIFFRKEQRKQHFTIRL